MNPNAVVAILALIAFCWVADRAHAAGPTAAGRRGERDGAGRPQGWARIGDGNGAYEGQIVRMFPKPGQDPTSWRCTKCDGEQKDAPVLGITFIKGMKRQGGAYEGAQELDT